jgi:hypothetical protein
MDSVKTTHRMKSHGHGSPSFRLRASPRPYFVAAVFLGPLALLWTMVVVKHPDAWQGLAASGAMLLIVFAWLRRLELAIVDDALVYRTLIRTVRIPLRDIESVGFSRYSLGWRYGAVTLILSRGTRGTDEDLVINPRPFDQREFEDLRHFLEARIVGPASAAKPPIIAVSRGDLHAFETIAQAESYMEPVDVRNGEYVVFDSEGRLLVPLVASNGNRERTVLKSAESTPAHASDLRNTLLRFLAKTRFATPGMEQMDLTQLLSRMPRMR